MEEKHQLSKWTSRSIILIAFITVLLVKFIIVDDLLSVLHRALGEFIFALILIYLLNPLVKLLKERYNINRSWGVTISFILMLALIVGSIFTITPAIASSIETLINSIPQYNQIVDDFLKELNLEKYNISPDLISSIYQELNNILVQISQELLGIVQLALASAGAFLGYLASFAISLLLAWYGLKEFDSIGKYVKDYITLLIPKKQSRYTIHALELLDDGMRGFIVGKLLTCLIQAILVYVTMNMFNLFTSYDIPYVLLMALIIGVSNIIPYIGPILGAIPCIFLALFSGFPEAVAVLAISALLQQIDNMVVSPRVLGGYVGISPFWTIAFMSVGGALGGIFGLIIAIPLGKVILTLIREFMDEMRAKHEQPTNEPAT